MTNLPISDLIRNSFSLAWRYKYLWLFGLFAAGGSGGPGLNLGGGDTPPDPETIRAWFLAAIAMILLVGLVLGTIVLILHVISKTGLIYNVYQIDAGGAHSLSAGWDFARRRFWPMMGLTLLQVCVIFFIVFVPVLAGALIFAASTPLGILAFMLIIPLCLGLVMGILVTWTYAERFLILESRRVTEAIADGWSLLKTEWRPSIITFLAEIGIVIGAIMVLWIVGLVTALPAIALWPVSKLFAIIYGAFILVPIFVVSSAYLGTFRSALWTRVFLALRAPAYAAAQTAAPENLGPAQPSSPMFE